MDLRSSQVQKTYSSQIKSNVKVLKEGSSVLVRVIASKGNGKYTGSVAGVRVNLSSSKPLLPGSAFVGNISSKNGVLSVIPKEISSLNQADIKIDVMENREILSLLQNLGLPGDSLSLNLFQMMKQMEMKIDQNLIGKLYKHALRFSGKEKSAGEILALLVKKGISADDESIKELISFLGDDFGQSDQPDLYQLGDKGKNLLNKINSLKDSWIFFPFEIVKFDDKKVFGNGCIKILFDTSGKIKILNLNCNYCEKKYLFNLNYEQNVCKKIRFYISSDDFSEVEKITKLLEEKLAKFGNNLEIEWADEESIEGFSCQTEELYTFDGSV